MVSQLIAALATTLPLYAIAAPTELCPGKVSWTVTGLHQLDGVQPNPLSGRSDKIRELQFTALSTANGASYTCSGFLFQSSMVVGPPWPDTQQWEAWTPDCHTDHTGDVDVDASFAFRFLSAWAEEKNDTHPAHIALRQNFTCGERNFQATGSTPVSLACALPYNPNSCFPCFAHECNGTTFEVVSDYVGDPVEESLDWG